jgi:hypothetical protein
MNRVVSQRYSFEYCRDFIARQRISREKEYPTTTTTTTKTAATSSTHQKASKQQKKAFLAIRS